MVKGKSGAGISLMFSKRIKGTGMLCGSKIRINRYQLYICLHIICTGEGFDI